MTKRTLVFILIIVLCCLVLVVAGTAKAKFFNSNTLYRLTRPVWNVVGFFVQQSNRLYERTHPDVIGGRCAYCAAAKDYPKDKPLGYIATLWDYFTDDGEEKIEIGGTVYQKDGKTLASDVIIYIYHSHSARRPSQTQQEIDCAPAHGCLRGWAKTNQAGEYAFLTRRPRRESTMPLHIHVIVQEPGKNAYEISPYYFDDDPLLTEEERNDPSPGGGLGILKNGVVRDGVTRYHRDIILGLHIVNYR